MASTPYVTARAFFGSLPTWINGEDGARLQAYEFYTALLENDTDGFKITLREDEENPIYVPSAKRIVKTLDRYVARDAGFTCVGGDDASQLDAITAYGDLFNREEFFTIFGAAKRYGLARGDWLLMLIGNPDKPEGSRISIKSIDPSVYFPIWDANDRSRVVGQQVIEQVTIENKVYVKVQRWLSARSVDHPSYDETSYEPAEIAYDSTIYEVADWEDPTKRKVFQTLTPQELIPGILTLPIYHFKAEAGDGTQKFGGSVLSGLERLFLAVNQAVTDEDVAVAMSGLGVYVTDQTPVDENGNEVDWVIGPRRVVQVKPGEGKVDERFTRVQGITSVKASQDHYQWILQMAESVLGIGDVALGMVDTTVAESGIALALRFGPIFDEATQIDLGVMSKLKQLFYDLRTWLSVYESVNLADEVSVEPTFGPKLPADVDKELARLQDLFVNGVLPTKRYLQKLNELGLDLGDPDQLILEAQQEAAARLKAQQDALGAGGSDGGDPGAFGDRLDDEAGGGTDSEE